MVTATGVGSGLDIESLVAQLMAAERAPVTKRLLTRETAVTSEISAFGTFKGALADFQGVLASLNTITTFGGRTAASSNDGVVKVSAASNAQAASYNLTVSQLARAHSLASNAYTSSTDVVGTGTITIRFGTTDYTAADPNAQIPVEESYNGFVLNQNRGTATLTIDSSNNTLAGVRDAINAADIGVSAVIVNDGTGYRLLLNATQTGAANSLQVVVADDDGDNTDSAGLSALAFNADATQLSQTVAAQDALLTVNGLPISHSDNRVSNVIDGVEISLLDISASVVTVTVEENKAAVSKAVDAFIKGYNDFLKVVNELTRFNVETSKGGPLQGDFSARSVVSQLRQILTSAVEGLDGPFSSFSEIGIVTSASGALTLDSAKFNKALENNFAELAGLFAAVGAPSDDNIEYLSASDATAVGNYPVHITQLATQGFLQGGAINSLLIDADNDSLAVMVDGIASGTIALTQGSYASGAELAAELQVRINGDHLFSEAGVSVTVSYDAVNNRFDIVSASYGSSSAVEIVGVDTATLATLGLSAGAGTSGVDVAGTIGGHAATGSGQVLSGLSGTAIEGLKLLVAGDALGDRGTVIFTQGIAYQLNDRINQFLAAGGILDARTNSLQDRIADIAAQREKLELRMEQVEARFRRQFNALDGLLAQLQSTSSFLTQQLASLPGSGLMIRGKNN